MNSRTRLACVRLLVALVAGSTAAAGVRTANLVGSAYAATQPLGPALGSDGGPTAYFLDEEERSAFNLFSELTHAMPNVSVRRNPVWNSWKTKCDVGLPDDCSGLAGLSLTHPDFFAMEYPTQTIHSYSHVPLDPISQDAYFAAYARAPQLASVLFNPSAVESIRRHHLESRSTLDRIIEDLDNSSYAGSDRHLPNGTFEEGSIAVKLFWELLPSNGKQPLRVFDDSILQTADPTTLTLPPVSSWQNTYKVNFKDSIPCPDPLPTFGQSIPISCLYSNHIKRTDAKAIRQLTKDGRDVVLGDPSCIKSSDVYAILVGIHIMRLTRERPQWEWMTFYLTNQDNQRGWKNPWRYFNLMSTDTLRSEAFPEHRYAYSPYLEAIVDGTHANCLNCHRLAAYSPQDNAGRATAAAALAATDPDPATRQTQEQAYFGEAVQTGFIWSLSTSQNQAEREAHKQFASQLEAYFERVDKLQ
jgi:hypothetical protein